MHLSGIQASSSLDYPKHSDEDWALVVYFELFL